ncbi:hypothetical protein EV646_104224 [Kribbella antiqua]|uniref:Uncharacterized protein n=1 Tax=Kribbella antiqua TaxID=2512217 RepID=A0A4R2IVK8_9ACTN|nr:hypothetical protein [Kribbella antiqua]TCO48406.1 hypothetical protein EV646_104224 [Kribbella antiqua]
MPHIDQTTVNVIIGALIPTVAALFATRTALRDVGLRRDLEVTRRFVELVGVVDGRPIDRDRKDVGVVDQVASIFLLVGLANRYRWLKPATLSVLDQFGHRPHLREAAQVARDRISWTPLDRLTLGKRSATLALIQIQVSEEPPGEPALPSTSSDH